MFVRDLARALQARGHVVFAYSSDLGEGERLLESDVLGVSTDLEKLPFQPDIIHAQHHLDAMTALTALPGVPALYHCHGAVWREAVPKHPRIYHYLAMSRTLAERIMVESNIAADDITLWWNTVDTARFRTVREFQNPREHCGRGCFANTTDNNRVTRRREKFLAQKFRKRTMRKAASGRLDKLKVIGVDAFTDNHEIGFRWNIARAVGSADAQSAAIQLVRHRAVALLVRPGHAPAFSEQGRGDPAHGFAANTDEMKMWSRFHKRPRTYSDSAGGVEQLSEAICIADPLDST